MNYCKCDDFSKLGAGQINNLLNETLEMDLKYRSKLSMSSKVLFGTEIEFILPEKKEKDIRSYIKNECNNYGIEIEPACYGFEETYVPLEIKTPKLTNKNMNLLELKNVFEYLYNNKAKINLYSSNHIHYDIKVLKDKYKYYERFLKFFTIYEPIIYIFSCGELNYLRNKINTYAKEIGKDYKICDKYDKYKNIKKLKTKYGLKEHAIRFSAFNTIEIRTPMGTLNPAINQNYILFFYKIFEYITSNRYDERLINDKFNKLNRPSILTEYKNINISEVLELCDLLYDNNLDKIYFLKQCLKLYSNNDYKYTTLKHTIK